MDVMDARRRIILNEPHIATASGGVASFSTDMIAPLKRLRVNFSPMQSGSGDPSPQNFRPISGWDGLTVEQAGKNLWANGDQSFLRNKTISLAAPLRSGTYTISGIFGTDATTGTTVLIQFRNASNQTIFSVYPAIASSATDRTSKEITLTEDVATVVMFSADSNLHAAGFTADFKDIQIEVGETATPYAPYTGSTYPVFWRPTWPNLYSGGDINGTQYVETAVDAISAGTYALSAIVSSADTDASSSLVYFYDSGGEIVGFASVPRSQGGTRVWANVTLTGTCTKIGFYASDGWSSSEGDTFSFADIWIDTGASASANFPSTVYGGYVDLVRGEVVAEWGEYTITGNESFDTTGSQQHILLAPKITNLGAIKPSFSSDLPQAISTFAQPKAYNTLNVLGETDGFGFGVNDFIIVGSAQYATWSNLVGEKIVFKLATPIHYAITPQIIKSLRGTNNIWSDANGDVSAAYWTH